MYRSASPRWQKRSTATALSEDEIHLWFARIDQLECHPDRMSTPEQERLQQTMGESRRQQYCASRSLLRLLLAQYLGCSPDGVELQSLPGGKPVIEPQTLHFNVSHTGDSLLLAFSSRHELGVDIEQPRPLPNMQRIAERVFPSAEVEAMRASDDPAQSFFERWTRYEAIQKCTGEGIFGRKADPDAIETLGLAVSGSVAGLAWRRQGPAPGIRYFQYAPGPLPL